jgi:hypothetical protein
VKHLAASLALALSGCVLLGVEESPCRLHNDCPENQLCVDDICNVGERPPSCQDHIDCDEDRFCSNDYCELGDRPPRPCGLECDPGEVILTATPTGVEAITLTWTAPGEHGFEPDTAAARYEIYGSEQPFEDLNTAPLLDNTVIPEVAGTEQSFTITGLTRGSTRYFALRILNNDGDESVSFAEATTWGAACLDGVRGSPNGPIRTVEDVNRLKSCEVITDLPVGPGGLPALFELTGTRYILNGPSFLQVTGLEELSFPDLIAVGGLGVRESPDLVSVRAPLLTGRVLDEDVARGIDIDTPGPDLGGRSITLFDVPALGELTMPLYSPPPEIDATTVNIEGTNLTSLDLPALSRLQLFNIVDNPRLETVDLSSVTAARSVRFTNNPVLSSCEVADLINQLTDTSSLELVVSGTLADNTCTDQFVDLVSCDPTAPASLCTENGFSISGAHPDVVEVPNIRFAGGGVYITNLASNVRSVTLPDLEAVGYVDEVSESEKEFPELVIADNPGLEEVHFPALTRIRASLILDANPNLSVFDAPNLEVITDSLIVNENGFATPVSCPDDLGLTLTQPTQAPAENCEYAVDAGPPPPEPAPIESPLFDSPRSFPLRRTYLEVEATDFNGDGLVDVAAMDATGFVAAFGTSEGPLNEQLHFELDGFTTGDFDEDGFDDAAVVSEGAAGLLFLGDTGGLNIGENISGQGNVVAASDIDDDGHLDLVVGSKTTLTLSYLRGLGDGSFTFVRSVDISGVPPADLGLGDVNGDGEVDVVLLDEGGQLATLDGSPGGNWAAPVTLQLAGKVPTRLAIADYNLDGADDIAVVNASSTPTLMVFDGTVGGTVALADELDVWVPLIGSLAEGIDVATADFDLDGRPDFVTAGPDDVRVVRSTLAGLVLEPGAPAGGGQSAIAAADLNNDNFPDVISVGAFFTRLLSEGDGSFRAPPSIDVPSRSRDRYVIERRRLHGRRNRPVDRRAGHAERAVAPVGRSR